MIAFLRGRTTFVACLWLVACGSSEPTPELTPVPPETENVPEVPLPEETPPETPPVTAPEETTPTPELPVSPETPEILPPSEPVIVGEPGELPFVEELERTSTNFEMLRQTIRYDELPYSEPARGAILRQLRAAMREHLADFTEDSGDPDNPNSFDASCDAVLALADTASYACIAIITEGRGMMDTKASTHTFEIAGDVVRELETDDLLIEGVDYGELVANYEILPEGAQVLTPTGIGFIDYEGEIDVVPYADLGALLNPRSAAFRIPGVAQVAAITTPLAAEAGPPESVNVFSAARPLPIAALLAAQAGTTWLFASGAPLDATSSALVEASELASPVPNAIRDLPRIERPWSTPARLHLATLHRATALRPAPRRPAAGPVLPADTVLFAVLGELAAGPSRTGGGQWTFVVVSESLSGWLPSALVDEMSSVSPTSCMRGLVDALPESERAAARAAVRVIDRGGAGIAVAELPTGTVVGYFPRPSYGAPAPLRALVRHAGTLVDARSMGTAAYAATELLALGWSMPGDPEHTVWEVHAVPASGTDAGAPIFTTTLTPSTAPERARQTVVTALTRRRTYYPLVVRGPGRAELLYTWNGTTLTPAE
jgi:hypothetical protein